MARSYEELRKRESIVYGLPGEYELDPEKVIERLLDIHDIVFELYKELEESNDLTGHKSMIKEVEDEINDVIDDIRYAQEIGVGEA